MPNEGVEFYNLNRAHMFKRGVRLIADLQSIGTILWAVLPPGVLGVITAVLARLNNVPWHLVLFYGTGVACFVALGLTRVAKTVSENAVHGKIRFDNYRVSGVGIQGGSTKIDMLNTAITINNTSSVDIWVSLDELIYSLQGKTAKDPRLVSGPYLVQGHAGLNTLLHSIEDIDASEPFSGHMTLKVSYGRKKDALAHKAVFKGTPKIAVGINPETRALIGLQAERPITSVEYE